MINPILTSSILALALLRTTTAFIPASSTCRHATTTTTTAPRAISTVLRNSSKPTTTNSPGIGKAADISSLTVPQLKTLLRENGLKLSGNKAELVSRLSTMAQESKQAKLSELSSVAMKMKEKKKQTPNQGKAPPGLKKQVAVEVESRKASASANAKTKASVNANTDKAASASAKANRVNGFSAIGVPQNLVARLDAMGIYDPTPIQKEAIPLAIKGRDVMGLAQTGTGKTLAFGLPLVAQMMEDTNTNTKTNIKDKGYNGKTRNKSVKGLVLAPTRELANQIAVQLGTLTQHTPIRTFVVVGGQSINTQSNKLKLGTELLVATPGRLIDLVERGALSLQGATFLVLDEADLMLDMGFAPSLRKIATMLPKKRQTMLFSATMKKEMNVVASSYLKDPVRVEVARAGKTADKIMQEVHFIDRLDKTRKLLDMLGHPDHRDDRAIVFGRTKHGMEKLSKTLLAAGIKAGSIHGNKSQPQRDKAIASFKSGEIKVLVATDVAARGLDIPDVKRVYNFELPNVAEAYVHRIGRTARAGKEGTAVTFCSVEEMDDLIDIQKVTGLVIPVASGKPWNTHDTKREKEKIKVKKIIEQRRQKENVNAKKQGGNRSSAWQRR